MTASLRKSDGHQCDSGRTYRLALATFVCVGSEGAIFLSAPENRYFGIDRRQARALEALVDGWPVAERVKDHVERSDAIAFAESLCAKGTLVRAPSEGRCACPPDLPAIRDQLIYWDEMERRSMKVKHWPQLIKSRATAHFELALKPLNATIAQIQKRSAPHKDFDAASARELVSSYYHTRIWAFRRKGRCLLDSLTLLEFLNKHGIQPNLVFGVKFRPFSAHAWLQHDDLVLNGTPAFVREYRPILVI